MKNHNLEIWTGKEELNNEPDFLETIDQEFKPLPVVETLSDDNKISSLSSNRRDFLKYLGFGVSAAAVAAGCEAPVRRAIPYVTKPDAIVPGVANYYASAYVSGGDFCPVLVKTREGRPIKIEGNALSNITKGGTSARAQASVLSLYDTNRLRSAGAIADGSATTMTWEELDRTVGSKLNAGSNVRLISNTVLSPTALKVIADFKSKYPNTKHIQYDPVSSSAMLQANELCFGDKAIPNYHFDKADVIVSFGADFLGTWISPVEYARQYASGRKIEDALHPKMSRHVQIESGMSMTGSNADNRILIKPSEMGVAIATLAKELGAGVSASGLNATATKAIKALAQELTSKNGKCLVVSASNNKGEQVLVNKINEILGSYGNTMDFGEASLQRKGIDAEVQALIPEMARGGVDVVIVMGANPAFDLPNAGEFAKAFGNVGTRISFNPTIDETTALCNYSAPTNHYLESWSDAEPKRGHLFLIQPTIAPLFKTRQAAESLARWAESPDLDTNAEQPYYEFLKSTWQNTVFTQQSGFASFSAFWDSAVHDGVVQIPQAATAPVFAGDVVGAATKITKPSGAELEVSFHETINVGAGEHADNPWLQEMPDPVTRCAWGNYLTVPITWNGSKFQGFKNIGKDNAMSTGDFVDLDVKGTTQRVSTVPSFGQAPGTLSIGLGYGRKVISACGSGIGSDVYPWMTTDADGNTQYYAAVSSMSDVVAREKELACVQYHHTMGVNAKADKTFMLDEEELGFQGSLTKRTIIRNTTVAALPAMLEQVKEERNFAQHLNSKTLYPYKEYSEQFYSQGHHWGMHVDLNACVGCGSCTIACMAENNVPVVGKREVHRHHEMSWLRIDRYFYGDAENPNVVYQPMMCQHCDNAPCENVCPVAATNHSSEGLNQMTYNRCIGTRYCANNCPYKVRRFNWLDYTTADLFPGNQPHIGEGVEEAIPFGADNLTRMVLNPDVTVRSRGVIEKCSFCVQRIQEGKLTAKREGRKLSENDVKSACMTACPTGAITFGDLNNHDSKLHKKVTSPMVFKVLEEVDLHPSVHYTIKVNNRSEKLDA